MSKGIDKYGFDIAILKFRSRLAVRMLHFYTVSTPEEWSWVDNPWYKEWAQNTFKQSLI